MPALLCTAIGGAHVLYACGLRAAAAPGAGPAPLHGPAPPLTAAWRLALPAGLLLLVALSGATASCSDPGYLPTTHGCLPAAPPPAASPPATPPAASPPAASPVAASAATAMLGGAVARHCHACAQPRPLRAKHCRACGRCVCDFDHHCPWINNCVGARNRASFYLFISLLLADAAAVAALSADALLEPSPHPAPDRGDGRPTTLLWLALAVAAPASLLLARFWLHRTRNALANLTTNERLNRRRYAHFRSPNGALVNPFDRGAARNCIAFLCPAKPRTASLLSAA